MRAGAVCLLLCLVATCAPDRQLRTAVEFSAAERTQILALAPLPPPPANPTNRFADDPKAARLGQRLFFEPRLSVDGSLSCASCHDPARGFADGRRLARGLAEGRRHTPALFNLGHTPWLFWDGRADSLWAQALGPLEAEAELGGSRIALWHLITGDADLRRAYTEVFGAIPSLETRSPPAAGKPGDPAWQALAPGDQRRINRLFANLGKAIEAYERRIVSIDSNFDAFVAGLRRGDQALVDRLPAAAQRGLRIFVGVGQCTLCHHGPNFSDGEFHNIGLSTPPGAAVDVGRYDGIGAVQASAFHGQGAFSDDSSEAANMRLAFVTAKPNNMGEFKTPSLRSVALTAPYMHDGRFASLAEVVAFYVAMDQRPAVGHREESLRPLPLDAGQQRDLVAFLESLTGAPLSADLLGPR